MLQKVLSEKIPRWQKEIHSVTVEQAQWRLKNWKMMIASYRRRGYSYPTISRIKKLLIQISKKKI